MACISSRDDALCVILVKYHGNFLLCGLTEKSVIASLRHAISCHTREQATVARALRWGFPVAWFSRLGRDMHMVTLLTRFAQHIHVSNAGCVFSRYRLVISRRWESPDRRHTLTLAIAPKEESNVKTLTTHQMLRIIRSHRNLTPAARAFVLFLSRNPNSRTAEDMRYWNSAKGADYFHALAEDRLVHGTYWGISGYWIASSEDARGYEAMYRQLGHDPYAEVDAPDIDRDHLSEWCREQHVPMPDRVICAGEEARA